MLKVGTNILQPYGSCSVSLCDCVLSCYSQTELLLENSW